MFNENFKNLVAETNSSYKTIVLDILIAAIFSVVATCLKDEIVALNYRVICGLLIGILLSQYANNLWKTSIKRKLESKKRSEILKKKIKALTKDFGQKFNQILKHEVRTTVFSEEEKGSENFLAIASRFNSYPGDTFSSVWQISSESNHLCKGVAGAAWSTGKVLRHSKLSGKDELKRLIKSVEQLDQKKLESELSFLNMSLEELKIRLEQKDRKYLFPKMIFAFPFEMENGKKIVVVVDSDEKNGNFPRDLQETLKDFSSVLKAIFEAIDQ